MLTHMLIRKKILISTILLTITLLPLIFCSFKAVYEYRELSLMVKELAIELETVSELQHATDDLLFLWRSPDRHVPLKITKQIPLIQQPQFRQQVHLVESRLDKYELHLKNYDQFDHFRVDRSRKEKCVAEIRSGIKKVEWNWSNADPIFSKPENWDDTGFLESDITQLYAAVQQLRDFILQRMKEFRGEVRNRYRALTAVISIASLTVMTIVGGLFWFFRHNVVQPFKTLLAGSRQIAGGDFKHRIHLSSHDELAELAATLNVMTDRFVEIEQNLNDKVQQRTREVVRSEQLASVGFLAAGVAHEINNPLASIAWSAEALESRLHEVLHLPTSDAEPSESAGSSFDQEQIEILRKYLRRIQDEAFRCKGITERLLDFSRLGESQRRQYIDINESVSDVVALVKHLGQYRDKTVHYSGQEEVFAFVSPTELKQVVLNLLTNALDACDEGGSVTVDLRANAEQFTLNVSDDGCGMTPDVLQHLFEPFFTRRRDGRGTGLGLSISYRIVQDHGGSLVPESGGPGEGAKLTLMMPLSANEDTHEQYQAAAA